MLRFARNDENSRIPRGFLRLYYLRILEFHIEIPQSSWGMIQGRLAMMAT
ncbi:MAG: hypothetical protein PUI01_00100 [Campylobacteraceae bacterium]|nr:hypothetical protein [Campylobacteraceae bacterium]